MNEKISCHLLITACFQQLKMVGYDPHVEELPQITYGLAGALSGFFTRAVSQPLDVLKIRLQVCFSLYFLLTSYSGNYNLPNLHTYIHTYID
jgi:hypothetical protein